MKDVATGMTSARRENVMEFQKLSAPSLKDLFIKQIQSAILSGSLPMGSRLPSERELAEQMQVSRAVVNGGLAELAKQGFLEVFPRKGTFVADYRRDGTLDTLIAVMEFNEGLLGNDEIRSVLEIDLALEHLAANRSIEYAGEEELKRVGKQLEKIGTCKDPTEAAKEAFLFHHELALAGGNSILPLIYASFRKPVTVLLERFCELHGVEAMVRDSVILYNFITRRDQEGVNQWIDSYLNETIQGKRQIYEKKED